MHMPPIKKPGRTILGGDGFLIQGTISGTLATGDGQFQFTIPFNCTIISAFMWLLEGGTTSGATTLTLSIGAVDINTTAGSVAHDASPASAELTIVNGSADEGDVLEADIDAIPGGSDSTDLFFSVWCERRVEL